MPATPTRPRLEQIRFTSSKTGTHNIDTYLESAEIGNRTLASLLADLFDGTNNGDFRTDIFDFRSSNGVLQFRVGEFLDANTGWQDVDFRTLVGKDALTFPMAASYPSQSLFILGTKLYISNATIQYTSQSAFDAGEAASEVTELFDAASLTTAELDAAVQAAQAAQTAAETATINNADFNALVARLTDIQNLANPAANRTALEAFGDSYAADNASNAITGLNAVGNTATAVTGLTNLKDSATPLANLSNSSAEINRLGATQNTVDAIELLGDNQTRIDAIDALGDATTSAAIDRLNQTDTSSPSSPQDTTADYIDALGTATMLTKLVALHAALSDINALAARTTEISALGSRTTEIDALYAIRADIDAIGDTATLNDISTVAGISTSHVASINQNLGTTDSPTFNAITVDTIDPDPNNNGTALTIAGNLIVSGTTTTVSSNTVNIGDSIITLNSDETGVPSQNAGFEVERGTSANVSFVWDEASDRFTTNSKDLAAGTITADGLNLGDNEKIQLGAATNGDLQIYHDGSNSYIQDVGTGDLLIDGASVYIRTLAGNKYFGGSANIATLYHTNNPKLATTSTGVNVTGDVTIGLNDAFQFSSSSTSLARTNSGNDLTLQHWGNLSFLIDNDANDVTRNLLIGKNSTDRSTAEAIALFEESGDISFYEDTGTTAKFFWDASAERLGIGTTSPATALDVTGTVTADGLTVESTGVTNARIEYGTRGAVQFAKSGTLAGALVGETISGNEVMYFGAGGNYAANPVFAVDASNQRVGIGTTTPDTALDVTGTVTADQYDTDEALPTSNPSLSLDFGNSVQIDPRINFSRASIGTYFDGQYIRTAGPDEPRIEYAADGTVKGLLIEEQRENLVTYSEDFSGNAWGKFGGGVIVADAATSPDGTSSASQFYGSDGAHVIEDVSATAGTTYTYSVFLKTNGTDVLTVAINYRDGGGNSLNYYGVDFNTATGVISAPDLGVQATTSSAENFGNGWFRLSISHEAPATTTTARLYMANRTGANASSSDGYLFYGAQLEAGSFATSYIPTNGTEVTREPDIAYMPVSEFNYNQSAGTVVVEVDNIKAGTSQRVLSINNSANSVNDRIDLLNNANSENVMNYTLDGGSLQADHTVSVVGLTSFTVAAAFAPDDYSMCVNGGTVVAETDGTPTVPTVDTFRLGGGVSSPLNGHIRSLKYWPQRLSDATLQAVTQG